MSADEIIKHIPQITSATKAVAAAVPFTAIVKRILGPAADEVAQMWADSVRMWRFERQASCVRKAETMLQDAGITPHTVSPKLLFPLLEGASFEDNDDLHTMWAALLANAASPTAGRIRPGFVAILREMAADEAVLVSWIYENTSEPWGQGHSVENLKQAFGELVDPTDSGRNFNLCLDALQATRLISPMMGSKAAVPSYFAITARGSTFVASCRPPKPKP